MSHLHVKIDSEYRKCVILITNQPTNQQTNQQANKQTNKQTN